MSSLIAKDSSELFSAAWSNEPNKRRYSGVHDVPRLHLQQCYCPLSGVALRQQPLFQRACCAASSDSSELQLRAFGPVYLCAHELEFVRARVKR